ncbi:MAG: SIR2 family protein [Acidobacteriota bacterium]|nr:SIR2 family protein [Acidobacteriota bacterium]
MIEPLLSLAFSIESNPGVYALLLGSGLSRAAGVPTGWDIVLDLVRRCAHAAGENCEPDPIAWYRGKFGAEPKYSTLLEEIAKTATERSQLLRRYFEPTADERERGEKIPTKAHEAIARLVSAGYIRVIVTTNFDPLFERALQAAGITPTVISTGDQAEGALPLPHLKALVLKVNGDYLDTRIKNSPEELASYDGRITALLDRIWEEHGILTAGWSAEWDVALRQSLERSRNRRFSAYWAHRSRLSESSQRLVSHLGASAVQIRDAEQFFSTLTEKVFSISDLEAAHPLTPKVAAATVKRLLRTPEDRIRLSDLVSDETERLWAELSPERFPSMGDVSESGIAARVLSYEALTETLLAMVSAGFYWGEDEHREIWIRSLTRIANPAGKHFDGYTNLLQLRWYPASLLAYAAGISAIEGRRYRNLAALFTDVLVTGGDHVVPLVASDGFNSREFAQALAKRRTPFSDHLAPFLRDPLRPYLPDESRYQLSFDTFELLVAIVYADLTRKDQIPGREHVPIGRFGWRRDRELKRIGDEVERLVPELLKSGLFEGSRETFDAAMKIVGAVHGSLRWY